MSDTPRRNSHTTDRPNIVWITLESVRADRTTLGGYERDTTSNLRRIVETGGHWFSRCFAHDRWTPAVSASILSGTYPSTHGVGLADTTEVNQIREDLDTVPELLSGRGYRTACFSSNPYVSPATALDRGFERFHGVPARSDLLSAAGVRTGLRYLRNFRGYGAGLTTELERHKDCIYPLYQADVVRQWLRSFAGSDEPFFLYTHVNSPHHPYNPPLTFVDEFVETDEVSPSEAIRVAAEITNNIWREVAEGCSFTLTQRHALRAVYDAEIAYVDRLVGQVFDTVRALAPENTVVVVTGDHGELFGEAGMLGHNVALHDGAIHVPLVTWGFGGVADRTDDVVQHIDVMETLVDAAGAPTDQFEGVDLRTDRREYALVQRGPRESDIDRIREHNPAFDTSRYHAGMVNCLRSCEWKYLRSDNRTELFRMPDETTDISADHPDVVAECEDALNRLVRDDAVDHESTDSATFTAEMEQHLEDLGYL